jgi:hypothetical protein
MVEQAAAVMDDAEIMQVEEQMTGDLPTLYIPLSNPLKISDLL